MPRKFNRLASEIAHARSVPIARKLPIGRTTARAATAHHKRLARPLRSRWFRSQARQLLDEGLRPAVLVFSPPRPTGVVQLFGLAFGLHLGLRGPCPTLSQFLPRDPGVWIIAGSGNPPAFISIILK